MATDHNFKVKNGLTVEAFTVHIDGDGTYGDSYSALGFGGTTNAYSKILAAPDSGSHLYINAGGNLYFRTNQSSDNKLVITTTGNIQMGSTTIIDSSRNLTNIPSIRLTNETDAALTSTGHAFQVGPTSGHNLIIDNNEMMARNNGSASTLYLQNDGGTVHIGANVSSNLQVDGNIKGVTGHTTGKFAVKSTSVHNSYDFYNNGTSYFNGTTEVNAEFKISSSSSYITHFNYQDGGNNIISQANSGSTTIRNNDGNLFTLSSAGSLSVVGNVIAGSSSNASIIRAHYNDGSYMTLEGFGLVMNRGASYIRPSTDANKTLYVGGADASLNWASVRFRSGAGLYLNGSQFIDQSRNLKNIGTINDHSIDAIGGFGFHHSSSTMTRAVGTGAQWIKVASFSGSTKFITLRVISSGDNTTATDVFLISVASYGMPANILKLPSTKYNTPKLLEVRTKYVLNAAYEIWIKVAAITTSVGYLTVSMNDSGVVSTLSAGTEPSVGSADTTLQVNATDRSDYTIQASKSISAESGFAVGSNQVIDSSRNLTNIGTISSGAITSSGQVYGTSLQARNDSGYGTVEVGGSSGAFIDLKKPATDDYDVRIVSDAGTGGRIQSNGVFDIDAAGDITLDADGGDIHLKDNGSSMASFTTGAATFAGTISSGAITATGTTTLSGLTVDGAASVKHANSTAYSDSLSWTAQSFDTIQVYNDNPTSSSSANQFSSIYMRADGAGNAAARIVLRNDNSGNGRLYFQMRSGAHTGVTQPKMLITDDGYVTISDNANTYNERLFVDGNLRVEGVYKSGNNTIIDASRNFYPYQIRASGGDDTPAGTQFSNVIKAQGTNRTIYFDGSSGSVSTWYGVGNNPYAAIDVTEGVLDVWVNPSSGSWHNVADFDVNGLRITYGTRVLIDSTHSAYFSADGGTNNWKYLSLKTNGTTNWDIATKNDDLSGALQFRPSGGSTNRTYMQTNGNWTFGRDIQAQNATFTGTGDVTVKIIADTDNVTETDNPTLGFSQDGNTAGTLFVLGLEGNANTVFPGSVTNAPYIHGNVSAAPVQIANKGKLVADFDSTAANPALTITKFSNITGTNGSTILNLKNYMGSSATDGDLSQQKSFIDFQLLDGNANEVPQVRIGAEVGEGGDANSQTLEGSGAFVVYTNDADTDGSSSVDAGASLTEKFRVAHDGTSTFTNNVVIGGNLTVNGTQTTLNTATLQVEDKNIVLNYGSGDTSGSANGAGITIQDAVNSSTDASMTWDTTHDRFHFDNKVNVNGYLQSQQVYSQDFYVLNSAGNGWHKWGERSDDRINLSVHDVSANGTITVSSGASSKITLTNSSDSNYDVELRTAHDYDGFFRVVDGGGVVRFAVGRDNQAYIGGTGGGGGNKVFHDGYHPDADNADTVDNLHGSQFLRSDAADTFTGNLTSGNNNWIRFVAANATDTNDGKIGAGVFASGLNIVGAQTATGTGRQVRIWGDLLDSSGSAYLLSNENISTNSITVGTTTDSSKITFPDKNVLDNPGAVGDKRQLISMGNSGAGGMWQTTGRGGLMLASADDSLILASGDVGRGHDPDAGGWNPNPDDENIYLLTDSNIIFRTNLQTVSAYKEMSFSPDGDLAVARNITASGTVTASGNMQHGGLTMTSGTDIDQLYTASQTLTITTSYQDTGINGSDLATGTYIVQLYAYDSSVGGAYDMYYSGIMSWYASNTNDTATDEIVLHRAGHASVNDCLFLRVRYTVSADTDDLKLQIKGNYNASGSSTYTFKFRRMI